MWVRQILLAGAILIAPAAAFLFEMHRRDPAVRLAKALTDLSRRPVDARLSGIEWPARPAGARRSIAAAVELDSTELRLRAVAADIAASGAADDLRAIAALLAGNGAEARRILQMLTSRGAGSATQWNNLAATLSFEARADALVLCSALAAADHALELQPNLPEARFNRAVILESLSLQSAAEEAFDEYLDIDGSSDWATEAGIRLRRLHALRTTAEEWRDHVPVLERAAMSLDHSVIEAATARFPQEARTWAETEFLGEWGTRVLRHDDGSASMLSLSRVIGTALRKKSGESLLADAVATIDGASAQRIAALATGHAVYREGRQLYGRRDVAGALPLLRHAQTLFNTAGSPMARLAAYYLGNALLDSGDREGALAIVRQLDTETPPSYRALLAQNEWLRGAIEGQDGFAGRNLTAFQKAYDAFRELGEEQNATEMRSRIAALLTILGRTSEAWSMRGASFASASRTGEPRRIETALYFAAVDALREERWDIAHSLLTLAADIESGNPRMHAEVLVWRALAAKRAGMSRTAVADLESARIAPAALKDPGLREDVINELRLAEAVLVRDTQRTRSIQLLTEYLASAERRGRTLYVPQVLIERARQLRAERSFAAAEANLRSAIDLIERRRKAIARDDLRDSFLGKSSLAYDALADLYDIQGMTEQAIGAADRRRARVILDRVATPSAPGRPAHAQGKLRLLPLRTAVLVFNGFEEHMVIYVLTRAGVQRFAVPATASAIEQHAVKLTDAIERGDELALRASGRNLERLLLAPATMALAGIDNLILVCDVTLQKIPFAALVREDGRFIIETYALTLAPSIDAYFRFLQRPAGELGDRLLAIGNPSLGDQRYASLPPLYGAEAEAKAIGAMYGSTLVLVSREATIERIARALPHCDVAHIGAHAIVDPIDARNSRLLLADGASLTTADIAAMDLDGVRTVILAGCRTAVATTGYGDVRSIAAGFLAAGAHNVIAALWEIDDDATRDLSVAVHTALREGESPARALRTAQLGMIHTTDARREPRFWAGLQLYSSGL